jgi:hypothetical protein
MTRLGRAGALFSGVLVLALAACSSILGIQDRSLDTAGADAMTGDGHVAETGVDSGGGSDAPADTSPALDSGGPEVAPCPAPCAVATQLNLPEAITADSNNIYWTEFGDTSGAQNGTVKGCPLAGCGSGPKVYATAQPNPGVILSDGQTLYWSNYAGSQTGGGIYSCPVSGCTGSPALVVAALEPWGIALDATYVYWVSQADESFHRAPRNGGADTELWDGGDIISLGGSHSASYVTLDSTSAYIIDDWSNLFKVPIGGGNALPLYFSGSSAVNGDWNLLQDPTGLLFGDGNKQALLRGSTMTPGAEVPLVMAAAPTGVARDPATGDIYWVDNGTGTAADGNIGRISPDGGGKTILVASLANPVTLTVAGGNVYWVDRGGIDTMGMLIPDSGAIYRTPK